MKLYRFRSLHGDGLLYALDMIVNRRIYLSTHDEMNDPDEGAFQVTDQKKIILGMMNIAMNYIWYERSLIRRDLPVFLPRQTTPCFGLIMRTDILALRSNTRFPAIVR